MNPLPITSTLEPKSPYSRELIDNLLDALCTALPYVEDSVDNACYRIGHVRKALAKISLAIEEASKALEEMKP